MKLIDWIGFLCFILSLIVLWQFRQVLLLVFAAIVLAIALNSLVRWIANRFGLQRERAVPIALILVLLAGSLVGILVVPLFVSQFQQLLQLIPKGIEQVIEWANGLIRNPPPWMPAIDQSLLPDFADLTQQVGTFASRVFSNFLSFFSGSVAVLLQLLLLLVLTLMILANPLAYRRLAVRLLPSFYRRRAEDILDKCEVALLCWMQGIAINSLFVATLTCIGLLVVGVKFAFAHAVLAGLFNFIPNIGPALSGVFPVLVALLDSPSQAITVIILYIVIQNVESYWFSPMVMQRQVSLLPAATLTVQLFFATLLGPLGLILALPLAVIAKTWLAEAWIKDVLDQQHEH